MSKNYCWVLFTGDSKYFWKGLSSNSVYNWIEVKISSIVLGAFCLPQKPQTICQFVCLEGNGKGSGVMKVRENGQNTWTSTNFFKKVKIFQRRYESHKKSTWDTVSVRSFNGEHIYVRANSNASSAATAILVTTAQPGTEQMFIEITRGKNISGLSLN